jgi:pilus assembly protein CpaF
MDVADYGLERLADELRERLVRDAARSPEGGGADERVAALVEREAALLGEDERATLRRLVRERALGLGPLEALLADSQVDEVMVNGAGGIGSVWVERRGRIEPTGVAFASEAELRHAIERILAPLGRRVDEAEPLCDARLVDGSRVNVVLPPLALDGPLLTIRRFRAGGMSPEQLVACGTLDAALCAFLAACVRARLTLLVSGGTGSGKTTTLGALSSFIGDGERIVTIEDAAELKLRQPHVVRLEARPASLEGRGEVTIRRLVRNAMRMRPDRIVVGEVRGAEAPRWRVAQRCRLRRGGICEVWGGRRGRSGCAAGRAPHRRDRRPAAGLRVSPRSVARGRAPRPRRGRRARVSSPRRLYRPGRRVRL